MTSLFAIVFSGVLAISGVGGFASFLVLFIQSFETYVDEYGATSYSTSTDYLVLFVLFGLLAAISIYHMIMCLKKEDHKLLYLVELDAVSLVSFIYGLAILIKRLNKGKDATDYWVWAIVSLVLVGLLTAYYLILRKHKKNAAK